MLNPDHDIKSVGQTNSAHKRASAFTLSGLLSYNFLHCTLAMSILEAALHSSLLMSPSTAADTLSSELPIRTQRTPATTLHIFAAILIHMDPSPDLIHTLLSPIVPALFTLHAHLTRVKTADPEVRSTSHDILRTWGRVVPPGEVLSRLWHVVQGEGGAWEGSGYDMTPVEPPVLEHQLYLRHIRNGIADEGLGEQLSNIFELRPDPVDFVAIVKSFRSDEVIALLFMRALDAYRAAVVPQPETQNMIGSTENDPLRCVFSADMVSEFSNRFRPLLYLQIILQVQSQMSEDMSIIVKYSKRILDFVSGVIQDHLDIVAAKEKEDRQQAVLVPRMVSMNASINLNDLRITDGDSSLRTDSDDEDELVDRSALPASNVLLEIAVQILLMLLDCEFGISCMSVVLMRRSVRCDTTGRFIYVSGSQRTACPIDTVGKRQRTT